MNLAWRIYRRLAHAFPHEFKLVYGAEILQLGEGGVEEIAKRHGVAGLVRLIADIAVRVPAEYLSEMRGDMRYGLRGLRKSPGFALVGIISMGLGIGLCTNFYSAKWEVIFRELPAAANAKRLAMPEKPVSYYYVERFGEEKSLFSGASAFQNGVPFNVTFSGDTSGKPERIFGQIVSPDYFAVVGVGAQRGRVFSEAEDKFGESAVVVISDRFWRNRLNASTDAVGQSIRLNGQIATIVGITPKEFNGALAINPAELFVPTTAPGAVAPELANDVVHQRNAKEFLALLCMAPGVSFETAEAGLDAIMRRLDAEDASLPVRKDKGRSVTLIPAGTRVPIPRELRPVLGAFFGALMGLVLTLACTNLANMLMARGANRRKELAIRLAVGASRFRLVRQMMSEGILLSLMGGVAGFVVAYGLSVLNAKFKTPTATPVELDLLDWRAGVFAFALSLICGIGFSLAPALQATKGDATPALKEGSALRLQGYRWLGLRNLLMVGQVAASLLLLLITGFLVIGFSHRSALETKFDPRSMYLLSVDPVRDGYSPEKAQAFFEKLPELLKTSGLSRRVALAAQTPFLVQDDDDAAPLTVEDSRSASPVQKSMLKETVGAGYFAALGEAIVNGREFEERDQRSKLEGSQRALPIVLNETAERKFFGKENAVGKRLRDDTRSYDVVGVIRDLKNGVGIDQSIMYLPLTGRDFARPPAGGMTILVRSDEGAAALENIRREIATIDPNLTVFHAETLNDFLNRSRSAVRLSVDTYGGMGIFGLLLAAIGLAGVTGYAVAQRRKEIAIRTALGASRGQVLRLVLREGTALVAVGAMLGFAGAIGMAKILSALANIFGEALKVGTNDTRLLIGAPLLLAAVAMLACYMPARRSARIDPLQALREE